MQAFHAMEKIMDRARNVGPTFKPAGMILEQGRIDREAFPEGARQRHCAQCVAVPDG